MRARWIAAIAVLVPAVLLAAAWLLPPRLDGSRYRASVAAYASGVLGRDVRIDGDVALHLLPQPQITARDIQIADAGDGVTMRSRELRLSVALGGLLGGRIEPRDLLLRGTELTLPWPFSPTELARPPAWLAGLSVRMEQGRVHLGALEFNNVSGTYAPDPVSAERVASFNGRFMGRPWHSAARLGTQDGAGAAPLNLTLEGEEALTGTGATFAGRMLADGRIAGQVSGHGTDLSQLLPAPPLNWRAEGAMEIAHGSASAADLSLVLGDSPAQGAVALRLTPAPRLDLALAVSRLDLDAWSRLVLAGPPPPALPGLVTGILLSAEAAPFAGGMLRGLSVALDLQPDRAVLREAHATLPGDAPLTLSGELQGQGAARRFTGALELGLPDPRATLRWLVPANGATLPPLPRQATLTGQLTVEPGNLTLTEAHGAADGARFTGTLGWQPGPRPAFAANLAFDHLSFDASWPASWPGDPGWDVTLRLAAPLLQFGNEQIDHLVLDAAETGGGLSLRTLQGGWRGAQGAISGTRQPDGRIVDGRLLLVAADAATLREALPPAWRGPEPIWHGKLDADLSFAGPPEALATRLRLDLGDARLEAQPVVNLPAQTASGAVTLRHPGAPRLLSLLGLPDPMSWLGTGSLALIAQMDVAPGRLALPRMDLIAADLHADGALSLDLSDPPALSGALHVADLPLPLLDPRASTPWKLSLLRGWRADLALTADKVSAAAPMLVGARARLALADGALLLDDITADLAGGGALAATSRLDSAAEPPALSLRAHVQGAPFATPLLGLPIDLAAGRLDADLALHAAGFAPAGLLATLDGRVVLDATEATLSGLDAAALVAALAEPHAPHEAATIRTALTTGSTPGVRAELALAGKGNGQALLSGAFSAEALHGDIGGTLDGAGRALDASLTLHEDGAPPIVVRLAGPLGNPARSVDLAPLAAWLAGR